MSFGLRLACMRMASIPWRWLRLHPGYKPYLNRLLLKQAGFSLFISGRKNLLNGYIGVREPIALYIFPLSFLAFLIPMRPFNPALSSPRGRFRRGTPMLRTLNTNTMAELMSRAPSVWDGYDPSIDYAEQVAPKAPDPSETPTDHLLFILEVKIRQGLADDEFIILVETPEDAQAVREFLTHHDAA